MICALLLQPVFAACCPACSQPRKNFGCVQSAHVRRISHFRTGLRRPRQTKKFRFCVVPRGSRECTDLGTEPCSGVAHRRGRSLPSSPYAQATLVSSGVSTGRERRARAERLAQAREHTRASVRAPPHAIAAINQREKVQTGEKIRAPLAQRAKKTNSHLHHTIRPGGSCSLGGCS